MKTNRILIIVTVALIAGGCFVVFLHSKKQKYQAGPDTIYLEPNLALPFSEAKGILLSKLNGSPRQIFEALYALEGSYKLVAGTPLLPKIGEIAMADRDYSRIDKLLVAPPKDDARKDKEIEIEAMEVESRRIALFIALANGFPGAMETMEKLLSSKSASARHIAESAKKYYDLYGAPNSPKPKPMMYVTRLVPFSDFVENVRRDIASGDEKKSNEAVEYIIRNMEMISLTVEAREILFGILDEWFQAKEYSSKPGTETYNKQLSALRVAALIGGRRAKKMLEKASSSSVKGIASEANLGLETVSEEGISVETEK